MVRTRIAPSPTGYPHIGTIYQALFNYAYAKKHGGKFIVRIEDTDRTRFVEGAEEVIFSSLEWFHLSEDESPRKGGPHEPYRQSERLDLYLNYAKELVANGHAYYCDCSPERLDEVRKKMQAEKKTPMYDRHCRELHKTSGVIRLKVPENKKFTWTDGIRGEMVFETTRDGQALIDDQVLLKSDGFPTYHLAVVVDDHLMEITHIVRGEEWISSTPKHILLYKFLGWENSMPEFCHTPLLRNPDKSKLSKRHGHTDVRWYKEEGYLQEAILNFLALLGWTHPEEKEIFPLSEFTDHFDLANIRPVGPVFDLTKLTWMNQQYIQMKSDEELKKLIKDFYSKASELPEETLDKLMPLVKSRMETLKDFEKQTRVFLHPISIDLNVQEKEVAGALRDRFEKIQAWKAENIFPVMKDLLVQYKVRMPVLYKILTGQERGLPLPETLEILGKEKASALLEQFTVNS